MYLGLLFSQFVIGYIVELFLALKNLAHNGVIGGVRLTHRGTHLLVKLHHRFLSALIGQTALVAYGHQESYDYELVHSLRYVVF